MIGGGLDGGFTATDLANIISTISLSVSDLYNKSSNLSKYFSWRLGRDNFLRSVGKWLGALGFAISTYTTLKDDSLSVNSKIGRNVTTFFAGVAIYLAGGLLATGILGVIFLASLTIALSYITLLINDAYFSARSSRRKDLEAYYA